MKWIESGENRIFKDAKALHMRKYRNKTGSYLVEGVNLVREAISLGLVEKVFLRGGYTKSLDTEHLEKFFMKDRLFDQLSHARTDQGIIAVVRIQEPQKDEFITLAKKDSRNILFLDRLQDPGNVGTIIRTAVGAGYLGALAINGTCDLYGDKALRAGSGALLRFPVMSNMELEDAVDVLRKSGRRIVGTDPGGGRYFFEEDLSDGCALAIGNEGSGISAELMEHIDINVTIPMERGMESLNAAVAAGILMYCGKWKGQHNAGKNQSNC